MDGPPLRHVTFRVQHDCPLARVSQRFPEAHFRVWSGHLHEVVEVACEPQEWPRVEQAAQKDLKADRIIRSADGGLLFWRPQVSRDESISRRLERHHMMWMQPMRVQAGWEHYDAFAFGASGEQAALDDLRAEHPTQVARRNDVTPNDIAASLFLSIAPTLEAPTEKQAEALLAAFRQGYYQSPRQSTTAQVAQTLGISRSAFEERLRSGENRVMGALLPTLERQRNAS